MLTSGTLAAFGLYLLRSSALVLGSPLIGTGAAFAGYKVALIGLVSLVLFGVSGEPLAMGQGPGFVDAPLYALYALREVAIGLFLAFVLRLVVMGLRVASDLIGHEMAFNMSNIVDPVSGVSIPLIAHMYEMLFFLALLGLNGHHWLFLALAESYERAPVGALAIHDGVPSVVVRLFSDLFAAGLTLAAPILVLLSLVSLLIGLLSRAVPHLNVLEFGFSLRIALGLGAMFLFAPLLEPAMNVLLTHLMGGLESGLDALSA